MSYYLPGWIYACVCVFNEQPSACWTPEAGIYTGQHLAAVAYLECKKINSADRMMHAKHLPLPQSVA